MTRTKYLHVYTMGCQMNVYDTEKIFHILSPLGYVPASTAGEADLVIANTCAIREKAEQKAFSFLGRTAELKNKKPELIVGIGGCVAQQEGERILKRFPCVDLVFGTDAIGRLPEMVEKIERDRSRMMDVKMENRSLEIHGALPENIKPDPSKFVTIMRGCDNFCTYCVVPYVRGRERSRLPDDIMAEIRRLGAAGTREVTLLGQNVNSYGKKEGLCSFAELIEKVGAIKEISRIRFTTSHPKDLSGELIAAFRRVDKLCRHIHLPVQSGANAVLKKMNRKYTREEYLEKIAWLKDACPEIAISSDIIVGFPGEREADFLHTLDLIKEVEYDSIFVFNYSDRPNAPAAGFSEKVGNTEKNSRFQAVLALQEEITRKKNEALIGSTVEVLVEGRSKKHRSDSNRGEQRPEWSGRTSGNKVVNFIGNGPDVNAGTGMLGETVWVFIEKAMPHSLWGRTAAAQTKQGIVKGEQHHVA